jgi:hypothetical protein
MAPMAGLTSPCLPRCAPTGHQHLSLDPGLPGTGPGVRIGFISTAATPCRIPDRPSILDFPSSDSSARLAPLPSSLCRSRLLDFRVVLSEIFFLWRPFLRDPRDDMVLELPV